MIVSPIEIDETWYKANGRKCAMTVSTGKNNLLSSFHKNSLGKKINLNLFIENIRDLRSVNKLITLSSS